jgi:hypothetical protein
VSELRPLTYDGDGAEMLSDPTAGNESNPVFRVIVRTTEIGSQGFGQIAEQVLVVARFEQIEMNDNLLKI